MGRGRDWTQDPRIQGQLRSMEARLVEQRKADRRRIMLTPEGRRFVYELIFEDCGLNAVYPAQDSGIYRHEGRRDIGLKIAQRMINEEPELYTRMMVESMEDAANLRKLREAAMTPAAETSDDPS